MQDVILVGFSYGGMVITGVAEEVPERIDRLVYLDAFLPQDGESAADLAGAEIMAAMEEAARAYGDGWRVPHDPPDADRRTDFLLKAAQQRITVDNPQTARLERTFVHFTEKPEGDFTGPLMAGMAARHDGRG